MTKDEFIAEAKRIHNNKYEYNINNDIVYMKDNIIAICPIHGKFKTNVYEHLRNKRGCRKCTNVLNGKKQRSSKEEFINKAINIHGNKYIYDKVIYIKSNKKVIISCPIHGDFLQTPNSHLAGRGCPKCGKNTLSEKFSFSTEQFIEKARKIHGDKYDYSKVNYVNYKTPITIICPIHGEINITPQNHLRGCGCPKCRYINMGQTQSLTTEQFIQKSKELHGDKYDYSKVEYKGYDIPVTLICPIHGEFKQTPDSNLQGSGCSKCGSTLSKCEDEIFLFLKSKMKGNNIIERDRNVLGNKQEIDIFIPSKKIAIEYDGLIWHSEKYGKDKKYHLNKTEKCKENGIGLIHIFEDEYYYHKNIVLSKLSHIIGCDNNLAKAPARKCVVKEIGIQETKEFMENNHIQGFSRGTIHIGAFFKGELIGAMSLIELNKYKNNWELVRFATKNDYVCQGIGGKIFSYFIKNYNPDYVKSFADRRWTLNEDNNFYIKIGFIKSGYIKPTYWYICNKLEKYKRYHKFNFRKNILHKKYGFSLDMTENEMTEKLGIYKIWDCGLIKYEWYKN